MPRLSHAQEAARRRVADVAAAGMPPERLATRFLAALQTAVPVDGFRLFGVDPATRLVNRLLAASETDGWARLEWLRQVYLAYGPLGYAELGNLMAAGAGAAAFQERQATCWGFSPQMLASVTPGDHYRLFHEQASPVGGTILAVYRAHGQWVAALQMYRRDPRRQFRPTDVSFLRLVSPTIGEALGASLLRERALNARLDPIGDAAGVLVLDSAGTVRLATPQGEQLSDRLRAIDSAADGPLPTAVWAAVARLRSADRSPVGTVTVASPTGAVRVEATSTGDDGGVAVVLAPVRPPPLPEVPVDWPLTPREREIVVLLLRGAGNREIADALSISDHTVETHLLHAYDKLDVGSRGQLMARFFRETFWPPLAAGAVMEP